jgi:hypothetical protein
MYTKVNYKPINVRSAELLNKNETYVLKHYGTEILRVVRGKIKRCLPVSKSSNSAIVQTLKRLRIYDAKKTSTRDLCMKLNGKSIEDLQAEWRHKLA